MTPHQMVALAFPIAHARGGAQERYRIVDLPWSKILTVNK
jgi:hypothetical protein